MSSATSGRGSARAVTLLVHAFICISTSVSVIVVPLLPRLAERYHATSLEIGLALTIPSLVMVLLSVPVGALADKLGARRIAISGAALVATGTVLQGFAPSLVTFLLARALFAVGWTAAWTSGPALLIERARADGGPAGVGALEVTAGGAFVVGPVLGAFLSSIGRAAPFLIAGGVAAIVFVGLLEVPEFPRRRSAGEKSGHIGWIRAATSGPTVLAGAFALLCTGFATGVINLVVPIGLHWDGASSEQIGLVFAIAAGLYIIGSALTVRFLALLTTFSAMAGGLLALAVSAAPAVISVSAAGIVAALMLHTVVRGGIMSAAFSLITNDADGGSGTAVGLLNMSFAASSALGPVAAGLLLRSGTVRVPFVAIGVVAMGGGVLLARVGQRARLRTETAASVEAAQ